MFELLIGGIFLSMLIYVGYKVFLAIPRKARPTTVTTSTPATTSLFASLKKFATGYGMRRFILFIVVGSLLWNETRESFWMQVVPDTVKKHVIGEVLISYKMKDLRKGETLDCLPQGIWKFVRVQTQTPHYQYTKGDGYYTGFYDKEDRSSVDQKTVSRLIIKDEKRFGNLLVSSDVSRNRPTGDVVVVKGECQKLTVETNLPQEFKGYSLLELGGKGNPIKLAFERE
ncbi:MAG: hypothetical protein IPN70_02175 [Candidatus Moraniibacteriota bacterium]|nr:MAG: hypothetical protein IPN70_02175 [Candidatus Moranbacteria bacterium]